MGLPRDGTGGEDSARTACGGTPQPRHASRPPRNPARPYPYYTQVDRLAGGGLAATLSFAPSGNASTPIIQTKKHQ